MQKMTEEAEKTKAPTQTEEEKKLMEEWEQHMSDFVPEDISTIVVEAKKEVVSEFNGDIFRHSMRMLAQRGCILGAHTL